MNDDWQHLQDYVQSHSPQAFAAIVRRYIDPIYSTCKRQLRDTHLAEDATQAVFIVLSQRAHQLKPGIILSGWLFQTARYTCANMRRTEKRRQAREQEAHQMNAPANPTSQSNELMPLLDDALTQLRNTDRNIVLLRYEQGLTLEAIAEQLGITPVAARQRMTRAIARLQKYFVSAGVTMAIANIPSVLENTVQAAPAHLIAQTINPAVSNSFVLSIVKEVNTTMTMLKLKIAASIVGCVLGAGGAAAGVMLSNADAPAKPLTQPPKQDPQAAAATSDWSAAIDYYARELQTTPVVAYRDKKDFDWIVTEYEKRAAAANQPIDYGPLQTVLDQKLKEHPEDSIYTWRLHRAKALIAKQSHDVPAEKTELEAAIASYPKTIEGDPSKHSSLQHLYNQYALILADDNVSAAEDYIRSHFKDDPRYVYFFDFAWQEFFDNKKQPDEYLNLAKKISDIYAQKARQQPAQSQLLLQYKAQLDAQLQHMKDAK